MSLKNINFSEMKAHRDDFEEMQKTFETKKSTVGYYNPITNPIPNFSSNPYIE